jgi:hypothetical protein
LIRPGFWFLTLGKSFQKLTFCCAHAVATVRPARAHGRLLQGLLNAVWALLSIGDSGSPNINGPLVAQAAAGTNLYWQPKDWFSLGLNLTASETSQSSGQGSVDVGGGFTITFQK